ncbi:TPA: guanylate kinase [Candidatus Galligastranaerophilus intestinavium]|uniref:Guanylate kinase n=1 Tax=Candidatus Galligastranaerophilus intestinavium TaxID=2840836 RepID=A0A9D1JYC5_9BACT|nr:guanylate kinase [Candidatus Galligastranaerophilus intestinavium]
MKEHKAKLYVLTGPSGVGKGTVLKKFFEKNKGDIIYSISATTRAPRAGEVDGVNYFFISKEEFEKEIKQDNFLEWAQYSGNYYGTRKDFVLNSLNKGVDVLLEIEVQGAKKVMEQYPYCVSIFITPPNMEELEKRLRGRKTECEEAILKRLEVVKSELSETKNYKYTIVNDKVDKAFKELDEIYQKERML